MGTLRLGWRWEVFSVAFVPLMWKARPLSLQSCIVVLFILNPKNPIQTFSLGPRVGWVYFLLEVFPCTPELAGWRALKSISKELGPLPIGANPSVSTSLFSCLKISFLRWLQKIKRVVSHSVQISFRINLLVWIYVICLLSSVKPQCKPKQQSGTRLFRC